MQVQKDVWFDTEAGGTYPEDLYRTDHPATYVHDISSFDQSHVDFFRTNGYLAIEHVFSREEVTQAKNALRDLIDGKNPDFTGVQFEVSARDRLATMSSEERQDAVRKLAYFVNYDQRLSHLASHPLLTGVLERLMAGAPRLFQDMALLKPPGLGREKPWHQDKAFFTLDLDAPVVGVWIALDAATAENGCMHIIPGSHLEGPVVHFMRRDWQICDTQVQRERDIVVPLPPGGCLFFDGLLHHGTPANRSSERRRALQYHYTTTDAKWIEREAAQAIFGNAGKPVTC